VTDKTKPDSIELKFDAGIFTEALKSLTAIACESEDKPNVSDTLFVSYGGSPPHLALLASDGTRTLDVKLAPDGKAPKGPCCSASVRLDVDTLEHLLKGEKGPRKVYGVCLRVSGGVEVSTDDGAGHTLQAMPAFPVGVVHKARASLLAPNRSTGVASTRINPQRFVEGMTILRRLATAAKCEHAPIIKLVMPADVNAPLGLTSSHEQGRYVAEFILMPYDAEV
jgi:hypothetical protein